MAVLFKNIHEAILKDGEDADFHALPDSKFLPTDAPAGSFEKIEVLRRRIELGQPLWHVDDRVDYSGLVVTSRPLERKEDKAIDTELTDNNSKKDEPYLDDVEVKGKVDASDNKSAVSTLIARSSSSGSTEQTHDLADAENVSSLNSLVAPKSYQVDDEDLGRHLTTENRRKIESAVKDAARPIEKELRLALAKKLFQLAGNSLESVSITEMTGMVDQVSTVAVGRELSQDSTKIRRAKQTLAAKLDKEDSELDKLLEDALASLRPTVFKLLIQQSLGKIERQVVDNAQRYFEHEAREWSHSSRESICATRLKAVGGLIQRILEPSKSVRPIIRQEQQDPPAGIGRSSKPKVIKEKEAGDFENVTLEKARSKELAQGLWRELQDDPKKLYQKALDLPKDKNMLSGEDTEGYFKRLFLVALTGAYKNSQYPPILKPLSSLRLDSYFSNSFFVSLNQYLSQVEQKLAADQSYSDSSQKKVFIGGQIYNAIPIDLFNIWATNINWSCVLEARVKRRQTEKEIGVALNLTLRQVKSIRYDIGHALSVFKKYFTSQNKASQLSD